MLAQEEISVVEGYSADLDCELVGAWGWCWNVDDAETELEWLAIGAIRVFMGTSA